MTRTLTLTALLALLMALAPTGCGTSADPGLTGTDVVTPDTPSADEQDPDLPGADTGKPDADTPDVTEATDPDGDGGPCDDDDPCTKGDHLQDGACVGEAYTCSDGKACTQDACDGLGGCAYGLIAGWCLIDGVCIEQGASPAPGNACATCAPSVDATGWTLSEDGACDDGDACTTGDHCDALGACVSEPRSCDDANACTDDWCDPADGCKHAANTMPCDDGDVCTIDDICVEGQCVPGNGGLDCDDHNACTADLCLPDEGCLSSPIEGACDDKNACTVGDACFEGVCLPGSQPLDCDDGNDCTTDSCDLTLGCLHVLDQGNPCCASGTNPCDDGNPCTQDICDALSQDCEHVNLVGGCDDHDACTGPDACVDGACVGEPLDCDDGNSCTTETCDKDAGCQYTTLADASACDDGSACTANDVCTGGVCLGDTMGCTLCPPEFQNPMNVVVELAIGADGQPGHGLDVDQNAATCAPTNKCSAGVDNNFASALATLAAFVDVNGEIADAIAGGSITILFEHVDPAFDGSAYVMDVYLGDAVNGACVPTTEVCEYVVDPGSLTDSCTALIPFADARIVDNHLSAGGPDSTFALSFPLFEGIVLDLTLYMARVEADVVVADGAVVEMNKGVLGGAVRQQQILDLVNALPDSVWADLPPPASKDLVINLIPTLFKKDIDTDGDGVKDATSIGILLRALEATVTGIK